MAEHIQDLVGSLYCVETIELISKGAQGMTCRHLNVCLSLRGDVETTDFSMANSQSQSLLALHTACFIWVLDCS